MNYSQTTVTPALYNSEIFYSVIKETTAKSARLFLLVIFGEIFDN